MELSVAVSGSQIEVFSGIQIKQLRDDTLTSLCVDPMSMGEYFVLAELLKSIKTNQSLKSLHMPEIPDLSLIGLGSSTA